MDIKDLEQIDTQKMHKVYDDWPNISKNSLENDQEKLDIKGINHVVFSGMGGSGSIGDVISSILSKENIHVTTVKGYHIPNNLDKNSLVVRASMTEKPFIHSKAFFDFITNFIYHEDFVKLLFKVINKKGIINIGGKSQSVYNFAKSKNLNIKKISAKKFYKKKRKIDIGMNLRELKKIV